MPLPMTMNHKLTEEQVLKIREMGKSGWSQRKLAILYNVSKTLIQKILSREDWKNI